MSIPMSDIIPNPLAWNNLLVQVAGLNRHNTVDVERLYAACMATGAFWEQTRGSTQHADSLARMASEQGARLRQACQDGKLNTGYLIKSLEMFLTNSNLGVVLWGVLMANDEPDAINSVKVQSLAITPGQTNLAAIVAHTGKWVEKLPTNMPRVGMRSSGNDLVIFESETHPLLGALAHGSWGAADIIWSGMDKKERGKLLDDALFSVVAHTQQEKGSISDGATLWAARLLKEGANPNTPKQATSYKAVHHGKHLIFGPSNGIEAPEDLRSKMTQDGWDLTKSQYARSPSREISIPYDCSICVNDLVLINTLKIQDNTAGHKWLNTWLRKWNKQPPETHLPLYGDPLDCFVWHYCDEDARKARLGNRDQDNRQKIRHGYKVRDRVVKALSNSADKKSPNHYLAGWSAWDTATMLLGSSWHVHNGGKDLLKLLVDTLPQDQHITSKHLARIVEGAIKPASFMVTKTLSYNNGELGDKGDVLTTNKEIVEEMLAHAIVRCHPEQRPQMEQWSSRVSEMLEQAQDEIMSAWEDQKKSKKAGFPDDGEVKELGGAWKKRILLAGSIPGKLISLDAGRPSPKI